MDGVMQYLLMAFGAVFSVAGLVLIFRKAKPDAGAAKIEFLGQKLEANSTGIVVFLIGAAFLAAPMLVPVKGSQLAPSTASEAKPTPGSAGAAVNPPEEAEGVKNSASETEDNNTFAKANVIENGVKTGGYLGQGDQDWFVLDVGSGFEKKLAVKFKFTGIACTDLDIFDASEASIGHDISCNSDGVTTHTFEVPQGKIYLRVAEASYSGNYTFTAASN